MCMYYNSIEYANERLKGTIVRTIHGFPIYIHCVVTDERGEGKVIAYILSDAVKIELPLIEIDLTPVELGYVNLPQHAVHISRRPIRGVWKQGFCEDNGNFVYDSDCVLPPFPFSQLHHTIVGNYPTFKACVDVISTRKSIAFGREFAINCKGKLLYNGREVGTYKTQPQLYEDNIYLEDKLRDVINEH